MDEFSIDTTEVLHRRSWCADDSTRQLQPTRGVSSALQIALVVRFIMRKKCFTVRILEVLHHRFVLHDRENLPCKVPKGKHS